MHYVNLESLGYNVYKHEIEIRRNSAEFINDKLSAAQ